MQGDGRKSTINMIEWVKQVDECVLVIDRDYYTGSWTWQVASSGYWEVSVFVCMCVCLRLMLNLLPIFGFYTLIFNQKFDGDVSMSIPGINLDNNI